LQQPSSQQSWRARLERIAQGVENVLLAALLGGLVLLATAQIVLRNFFSVGVTWGDGLIRLLVLWLALLGAVAAARDGRHITMGALSRWLPERLHRGAEAIADIFAAAVSGALAYFSYVFVRDSHEFGDTLLANLPAWWFQVIMPIAFALIAYRYLVRGARRIRGG
jgi:TRAP-type C4-dicarboxylate transport system permease small subunit